MITDFTKEHPDRTLWRFWIPMMFSVMFQQIYNIADSMIAGKFAGEDALGSGRSFVPNHNHLHGICSRNEPGSLCGSVQIIWRR